MASHFSTHQCHYRKSIFVCLLLLVHNYKSPQWLRPPTSNLKRVIIFQRTISKELSTSRQYQILKNISESIYLIIGGNPRANAKHGSISIGIEGWHIRGKILEGVDPNLYGRVASQEQNHSMGQSQFAKIRGLVMCRYFMVLQMFFS